MTTEYILWNSQGKTRICFLFDDQILSNCYIHYWLCIIGCSPAPLNRACNFSVCYGDVHGISLWDTIWFQSLRLVPCRSFDITAFLANISEAGGRPGNLICTHSWTFFALGFLSGQREWCCYCCSLGSLGVLLICTALTKFTVWHYILFSMKTFFSYVLHDEKTKTSLKKCGIV